jgi:hypothetical protein
LSYFSTQETIDCKITHKIAAENLKLK